MLSHKEMSVCKINHNSHFHQNPFSANLNIQDRAVRIVFPQFLFSIALTRSLLYDVSNNATAFCLDFEHIAMNNHFLPLVLTIE